MNDNLIKFREYYKAHINEILSTDNEERNKDIIEEFNKEFPIEKIKNLTLDQYIYKGKGADTFCSRLADYYNASGNRENLVGPSISAGAINEKFGIHYQDGYYRNYKRNKDDNKLKNPQKYYEELKRQLVDVLINISNGNQDIDYKKYDHLYGMYNIILKLAFYIKPENNITFGNQADLEKICNYFGIEIRENDKTPNLSFKIKKFIDKNVPESKGIFSANSASILYDFAEEYIRPEKEKSKNNNKDKILNNKDKSEYCGKNVIFYGVPGCGKSWEVKRESKKFDVVVRTVFHPDYTYTDFIGQVMPLSHNKNKVIYSAIPGPFTKALVEAIKNDNKEVLLIIEEINRGNAAAIFGDIFQLLDREENEYEIDNEFISRYIRQNTNKKAMMSFKIPKNLTIIATMNTSDQNVYTLDTAFRRRFEFKRVNNKVEKEEVKNKIINGLNIKWGDFINVINDYIVNTDDLLLNNEDKRLGAYSMTISELDDKNKFADKILFYLWDNIGKYNNDLLFQGKYKLYDTIIDDFLNGEIVFCQRLQELLEEKKNEPSK